MSGEVMLKAKMTVFVSESRTKQIADKYTNVQPEPCLLNSSCLQGTTEA